ncbi:hypothetical protein MP228_012930 [Amoeboaphelidium protococcarum]|nr:hypothetical protein MP228_012930 [Amoeboaphelidium protococcarum]
MLRRMSEKVIFQFNTKTGLSTSYAVAALSGLLSTKNTEKKEFIEFKVNSDLACWEFSPLSRSLPSAFCNQSSIMKYLVRANAGVSSLYPLHEVQNAIQIDRALDLLSTATESTLVSIVDQLVSDGILNAKKNITIADVSAWSLVKSSAVVDKLQGSSKDWFQSVDARPQFVDAVKIITHLCSAQQVTVPATTAAAADGKSKKKAEKPQKIDQSTQQEASLPRDIQFDISHVQSADYDPLSVFRYALGVQLQQQLGIDAKFAAQSLEIAKGGNAAVADFSVPIPKLRIKGNPTKIAADVAANFKVDDGYVSSLSSDGPFLSIKLDKKNLLNQLINAVHTKKEQFGQTPSLEGQTVVVEFSSPNIAKPFHAGHLRSTIIGNFVRNIAKANSAKTLAINYLGDWGKQYGLLAVGFERFGSEDALKQDPIRHLFDIYVKISKMAKEDESVNDEARAYFKQMEDGDEKALALWRRFRALSIEKYKQIYARLNIEFDIYSGESMYSTEMQDVLAEMKSLQLLQESDGAQIIDLKKFNMGAAVIQKSDGTTLYITRDIAAALARYREYKFDKMIYVVANQQELHFRQLFKTLELAKHQDVSEKCQHIGFGLVNGMSTRKGNVVFLEDILEESKSVMLAKMKENETAFSRIENVDQTSDTIGLSAVFIQDMGGKRVKDYDFNWDRMTSFEGDTGPYLQYAHARLCSIERNFINYYHKDVLGTPIEYLEATYSPPLPLSAGILAKADSPKLQDLAFILSQFPELIAAIPYRGYEPCNLVVYLFAICHKISSCLDDVYVMDTQNKVADKEILVGRFWTYWAARVVLGNGMRLLGLRPLTRM